MTSTIGGGIGIGVYRHSAEGSDADYGDQRGHHQHEEVLFQRELDYAVDHDSYR